MFACILIVNRGPSQILTFLYSIYTKSQEFHTWLVEERKINPETISRDQSRKEFAKFVEDYNTGDLKFPLDITVRSLTE